MRLFIICCFLQVAVCGWCADVIAPPDSRFVKDEPGYVGGKRIDATTYISKQSVQDILSFYDFNLRKEGFVPNTEGARKDKPKNILAFRKGARVVTIFAEKNKDGLTKVIVGGYDQPEGSPLPDLKNFNWKDMIKMMPQEDVPGADLNIVPRPPKSVRQHSVSKGNVEILSYTTKSSVDDVVKFYSDNMDQLDWRPEGKVDYDEVEKTETNNSFAKASSGPIPSLGKFLQGSKQLSFVSFRGKVDVTVMNIDPDDTQLTLINIYYEKNKADNGKADK